MAKAILRDLSARLRRADLPWAGVGAALLALLISSSGPWRQVELKLFDALIVATAPNAVNLPITIVGIDEASFAQLKLQWPWPRSLHAKLLDNLRAADVAVAAFDVVFSEPTSSVEDEAFAAAIHAHGNVILAADLAYDETGSARRWIRVDPLARFSAAGADAAFASVQIDPDGVQRQVPVHRDAFWRQILLLLEQQAPGTVGRRDATPDMRIRYAGGPHTFSYISYYQLLEPEKYLSANWKEYLRNNVVIIGRDLKASTEVGSAQSDMFQTPFFGSGRQLMPGPEVQANLVATMADGVALTEAPASWSIGLWLLTASVSIFLMRRWQPLRSSLLVFGLLGGIVGGGYALFVWPLIWLPVGGAVLTVSMVCLAQGGVEYLFVQRQRRQLRRAFEKYVAPSVVEQMVAQPEKLRIGGERRELTLIFTDLAGFTGISEQMDPTQVASLLNRHLSEMTEVILRYQGTVDKFIGDAVMAFWGAPIEDPDQCLDAVRAAIDMQETVALMRKEMRAAGGPELFMRVGIHRGDCIVGNLGGDNHFDYTAIGDTVNLASRLEGVNKVYGTDILLSDAVARELDGQVRLRAVDTVIVKGRQVGIDVFTPCADERLIALSDQALRAYRLGAWEAALAGWREVLDYQPGDGVARAFLARLHGFQRTGWPRHWDAVTHLDSK